MLIFPHATPAMLVLFAMDTYLIMALVRWLVANIAEGDPSNRFLLFKRLVDAPARATEQLIVRCTGRPVPRWIPWVAVLAPTFVTRQLLAGMVFRFMTPA